MKIDSNVPAAIAIAILLFLTALGSVTLMLVTCAMGVLLYLAGIVLFRRELLPSAALTTTVGLLVGAAIAFAISLGRGH